MSLGVGIYSQEACSRPNFLSLECQFVRYESNRRDETQVKSLAADVRVKYAEDLGSYVRILLGKTEQRQNTPAAS